VARQQARRQPAAIADLDRVGEDIAILRGLGLVVEIAGRDSDVDGVVGSAFHAGQCKSTAAGDGREWWSANEGLRRQIVEWR